MEKKQFKTTHMLIFAPKTDKEKNESEGQAVSLGSFESDEMAIDAAKIYNLSSGDLIVKIVATTKTTWEKNS